MRRITITRVNPKTGRTEVPHLYRDGFYRVGDPANGSDRHKKQNEVRVRTLEEVLDHLLRGGLVRMSAGPGTGGPSQICRASLEVRVDGVQV
ncbi:MAG TPA: hypothetical protein VMU46_12890 [Burkholderiales bacterium]|nr:hypothetical protein [Burkholderiales bacterium]